MQAADFLKAKDIWDEKELRQGNINVLKGMLEDYTIDPSKYHSIEVPGFTGKLSFTQKDIESLIEVQQKRIEELYDAFGNI